MIYGNIKDVYFYATVAHPAPSRGTPLSDYTCSQLTWVRGDSVRHEHNINGDAAQKFWTKACAVKFRRITEQEWDKLVSPVLPSNTQPSRVSQPIPAKDDNIKQFGVDELKNEFVELRDTAKPYYDGFIPEQDIDTSIIFSKKIAKIGRTVKSLMDAATAPISAELARVTAIYKPLVDECRTWSQTIKSNAEKATLARRRRKEKEIEEAKAKLEAEQKELAERAKNIVADKTDIHEILDLSQKIAEADKQTKKINEDVQNAGAAGVTGMKATIRKYPSAVIDDYGIFLKYLEENAPDEFSKIDEAMVSAAKRLFKQGKKPAGATETFIEKLV